MLPTLIDLWNWSEFLDEFGVTFYSIRTNAENCMIVIADKQPLYNAVTTKNGNLI